MMGMLRFGLKDMLRGMTLAAIGFGMLAVAFHRTTPAIPKEISLSNAFLVAFGGTLVGYGFAFPFKWPPHQMLLAMLGMFAAQAWQTGNSFGLLLYLGLLPLFCVHNWIRYRRAEKDSTKH
jgi:hypothetical protein